jgi:hypothetical protein
MNFALRCGDLDRLVTVEMGAENVPLGSTARLYDCARGDGPPITLRIAEALLSVPAGSHVGMLTGVYVPPFLPHGEHDGPVGAVVLGKVLGKLGMHVSILVDEPVVQVVEGVCRALGADGVQAVNADQIRTGPDLDRWAGDLDVAVSIEKAGLNRKGVTHSASGTASRPKEYYPYADGIVERMNAFGKLTIGIGDHGNEVGFGSIFEYAREVVEWGAVCKCPCQDGTVTRTPTTILFPVAICNWGVYAIVAAIAMKQGNLDLLHRPETELLALNASLAAGSVDGSSGKPIAAQDSVPALASAAMCKLLCTIAEQSFTDYDRGF